MEKGKAQGLLPVAVGLRVQTQHAPTSRQISASVAFDCRGTAPSLVCEGLLRKCIKNKPSWLGNPSCFLPGPRSWRAGIIFEIMGEQIRLLTQGELL